MAISVRLFTAGDQIIVYNTNIVSPAGASKLCVVRVLEVFI